MTDAAPTETPAPPPAPFSTVGVGALASALGTSRSSLLRAIVEKQIPDADGRTLGKHRRWSLALAAQIVRAAGRPVPQGWSS